MNLVKTVGGSNGYEALRQMILALRPNSNSRGLALLSAATSWPQFNMQNPIQEQLLKLEDVFEEARKAGITIQPELKTAILMKSVGGQLETHFNLAIQDSAKYEDLREQVLRWDRAQHKWAGLITDDVVAMDISRVGAYNNKGWWYDSAKKGAGKFDGKAKGKGSGQKGNSKGKTKGKSMVKGKGMKGKGKKGDSKGYYGKSGKGDTTSKGKGKSSNGDRQCYNCGRAGHLAKDCWNVRNVQQYPEPFSGNQQQVSGSPASSTTGSYSVMTSASQMQQQQNQQVQQQQTQPPSTTQHRVAQIRAGPLDTMSHEGYIFDLPGGDVGSYSGGFVNVVQFYIGDEDSLRSSSVDFSGDVRAMCEAIPDDCNFETILLDSGADSAVFPARLAGCGEPSEAPLCRLHDAQGREIPAIAMKDVEVHLMDVTGKEVVLRESVAISNTVTQPILCRSFA